MKSVVVGMSGGVDSSVAALLLKNQGYKVFGLYMKNIESLSQERDEIAVRQICEKLDIPFEIVNYSNEMDIVKSYFLSEYDAGRTPNPCVVCNREVKFKPFIEYADKIGADFFATGHYANVQTINGETHLLKAVDQNKDQTYFLNQLSQKQLARAIFPVGNMIKTDLRKFAEQNGLVTAHKKDSFDICFVGSQKFRDFMEQNYPQKNGDIVDIKTGKKVGTHTGIMKFTMGQRRGLNIGGQKDEVGRWFVVQKDIQKNVIYVSNDDSLQFSTELVASNVNWIPKKPETNEFECFAKCRYREPDQKVKVKILPDERVFVHFENPQRAVATGQFVVFYTETECIGGGTIEEVIK